jgi:hypothetical protein
MLIAANPQGRYALAPAAEEAKICALVKKAVG